MKKSMFIQTNSRVVKLMPSNEAFKELNQNYVDIFNVPTLATNEEIKIIMHFYKKKIHRDPNLQEDIFI
jgi:hypothetical protein